MPMLPSILSLQSQKKNGHWITSHPNPSASTGINFAFSLPSGHLKKLKKSHSKMKHRKISLLYISIRPMSC